MSRGGGPSSATDCEQIGPESCRDASRHHFISPSPRPGSSYREPKPPANRSWAQPSEWARIAEIREETGPVMARCRG
jgi:hypothetical protein